MNDTGPDATPFVEPTMSSFPRSLENENPVPPPDLCISAVYFSALKIPSTLSSTGSTKHAESWPSLAPAFIMVGELGTYSRLSIISSYSLIISSKLVGLV
jgi:hypothetical protein